MIFKQFRWPARGKTASAPQVSAMQGTNPVAAVWAWPAAFQASVLGVAGLLSNYMLIMHGISPADAALNSLEVELPLVAMMLPASSVGATVRTALKSISNLLSKISGGGQ